MADYNDICFALAAMAKASYLLDQLAQTGECDQADYLALRQSLFIFDSTAVSELYGGRRGLQRGFKCLRTLLQSASNRQRQSLQISRYLISAMHLERLLRKQTALQKPVLSGLKRIKQSIERQAGVSFHPEEAEATKQKHDQQLDQDIAKLYSETFGHLRYRTAIIGKRKFLENPEIAAKCRCLLFMTIRAAALWQQVGGRHWQLVFKRKHLAQISEQLLLAP